jgi:aldehyde dehydrogenase (NAD+)
VQPTVFTVVRESMRVYREGIFGPVAVIASFATEDEAVDAACGLHERFEARSSGCS